MLASHSVFELNRSSFFFILDYSCFDLGFFFLVFFLAVSSHIKSTSDFYLLAFFR